jgi:hypothetical protein
MIPSSSLPARVFLCHAFVSARCPAGSLRSALPDGKDGSLC